MDFSFPKPGRSDKNCNKPSKPLRKTISVSKSGSTKPSEKSEPSINVPEAQKALVREELGYIGQDEVIVELPTNSESGAGQ